MLLLACNYFTFQAPRTMTETNSLIRCHSLDSLLQNDRKIDIFGEKFSVSKELVYSYVRAEIVTDVNHL